VSSPNGQTRIGLIIPKFRQSAVMRNRLKRRLRELSRIRLLTTQLAADIVIRVRPNAYDASFADLALEMDQVIVQLTRWSHPKPAGQPSQSDT
jgi:ribonuclease P protein component